MKPEGLHLDFKHGLTSQKKIAKTLLAFANTEGGEIIVGVSDERKFIGIDPQEEMFMVFEAIRNYCQPTINVKFEVFEFNPLEEEIGQNEKYLLIVNVPKSETSPHLFVFKDDPPIYYKRLADRSLPSILPNND
ncbi:MAG: ATP-binding protein [Cyclobacteriaceae bacterium]